MNLNERDILTHAGKISHEVAKELAEEEYEKFYLRRINEFNYSDTDFEMAVKSLLDKPSRKKPGKKKPEADK